MSENIWTCKVGGEAANLPKGSDLPMRQAVSAQFLALTGDYPVFCFSGWGGELDDADRAVVEDRDPTEAEYGRWVSDEVAKELLAERTRQVESEIFTTDHDDKHNDRSLAAAAGCYALSAAGENVLHHWPWHMDWFKPGIARRALVKAGALIIAEIERLDRRDAQQKPDLPTS